MSQDVAVFSGPTPYIRRAALDRPWVWLARGWADLQAAPVVSLSYGVGFVVAAFAISIGSGQTPSVTAAVGAFRANPEHMAYMGFVLMLINLFWTRMAMLIFALFFGTPRGTLRDLIDMTLFSPDSLPFLIVGTLVGFVLAAAVFAISAVSIPMLLDRPQTPVWVAIATSFVAVRTNLKPMALWAALICAFTGFGMIPMFLGLAVTMPLIGHATWHCYKDIVDVRDAVN